MAKKPVRWKRGRGKLGALSPLLGSWAAEADSPMGPVRCTRAFTPVLGGSHIQLNARWEFSKSAYEELAFFGPNRAGELCFWSFTSDGKNSQGALADVSDAHPEAIGFEAEMPAGRARMIYWPDDREGFRFAVEARNQKGWKRFLEHHYRPA